MNNQLTILLAFFTVGIIAGMIFDIFRTIRKCYKTPNCLIYIQDFLFWILTGVLILYATFIFSNGEIRLYMILTLILGSIFYFTIISRYFLFVSIKVATLFKNIVKTVVFPLKKLAFIIKKYINLKKIPKSSGK